MIRSMAASASSVFEHTNTPLPAARPSALTTNGSGSADLNPSGALPEILDTFFLHERLNRSNGEMMRRPSGMIATSRDTHVVAGPGRDDRRRETRPSARWRPTSASWRRPCSPRAGPPPWSGRRSAALPFGMHRRCPGERILGPDHGQADRFLFGEADQAIEIVDLDAAH